MTYADAMNKYLKGELSAVGIIRLLSGAFDAASAVNILAIINAITRIEEGDLDKETFREMTGLKNGE